MAAVTIYTVKYRAWDKSEKTAVVDVREATTLPDAPPAYYALCFAPNLGCGKQSATKEGAVRRLVQDHSEMILSITPQ